jgi:hypothetical protein
MMEIALSKKSLADPTDQELERKKDPQSITVRRDLRAGRSNARQHRRGLSGQQDSLKRT